MRQITLDWEQYTKTAIRLAEEGTVLLKNDNNALPITKGEEISLWGRMQNYYYKSGTGSGGMVNVHHVVTIREAFDNEPDITINPELAKIYDDWTNANPVDLGVGWGGEPWSQKEMPVDEDLVSKFAAINETAVVVIARTAGEDRDNSDSEGAYRLSKTEEQLLELVCKYYKKSVVLLNVGTIIDMSFVSKYNPSAVMYLWQAGMVGGTPAVNLLSGRSNPSGRLTDTIAYKVSDYPAALNFGNKDPYKDFYEEDIFVGYRYFSTFAREKVLYPFGYGLSYSTFELDTKSFEANAFGAKVEVEVTNTGKHAGKTAVLMFASAPQGKLSKPELVLCAFGKTNLLQPGESEILTLKTSARDFASYDDDNRLELGTGFVLEEGTYRFYIGYDAINNFPAGQVTFDDSVMVEAFESALKPYESYDRMAVGLYGAIDYEEVPTRTIDHEAARMDKLAEIKQTGDRGIKLADVKTGKNTMEEFVAQLDDVDLSLIIRGEGMGSPKVTIGTAGAFGGVTKKLQSLGVPVLCCSDGPSGMRIDSGKKAFSLPSGTLMAASFNLKLVSELYEYLGKEMISNKIDTILGPGINIHRFPLNGRNFEYFSEDPYLTGHMACAQIEGLERNGVTATIKHFAFNNREFKRREMNAVVSERAAREIYLRAFEIAVREGAARSIMTVYNIVNGTYGAGNYDLNTVILREQWGYKGIVMSDWWAYVDKKPRDKVSVTEHSMMARAQNDLYMVCSVVENEFVDEADTYQNLKAGRTDLITRAELQRNSANILRFAMNTPAMDRMMGETVAVEHLNCPFAEENRAMEVDAYYDLRNNPVITFERDTTDGMAFAFGMTVEKPGYYDCIIRAKSELNPLAQIPMTVFYTSIPVKVITWNGTEGAVDIKSCLNRLSTKHSVIRIEFGGKGVQLLDMTLKYKCRLDELDDKEGFPV